MLIPIIINLIQFALISQLLIHITLLYQSMTKFFLPQQRNASANHKKIIKKQSKPTQDYKMVIFKKLLALIKAQHAISMQKIIRKIKQRRQKSADITALQAQLIKLKSIKKQDLKIIIIYIMSKLLKIENIDKLLEEKVDGHGLEELVEKDHVKELLEKVYQAKSYQEQLQKCSHLCEIVNQKRKERKEKRKETNQKKKENKKAINIRQELQDTHSYHSQFNNQEEQIHKQTPRDKQKQFPKVSAAVVRTEFKKTGRNKFFQQKRQKHQKQAPTTINHRQAASYLPLGRYSKQVNRTLHPSWAAKMDLKNQMFIQPFQGRKTKL